MGGVVVELRPLVLAERVLDGELVQAELAGELVELVLRRSAEVDPHDRVGLLEVVGDVGDREVLGLENALAVHPGHGLAHGSTLPALARTEPGEPGLPSCVFPMAARVFLVGAEGLEPPTFPL